MLAQLICNGDIYMGLIAIFVLVVIPAIEIYLFIEIGGAIGAGWTLLLIILTGIWGVNAMRTQGLSVLAEAQAAQATGRPPVRAAAHGILILAGGLLLMLPGFFTDTLGFCLMVKPFRFIVLESLISALMPQILSGLARRATQAQPKSNAQDGASKNHSFTDRGANTKSSAPPEIIEGDFRVEDDERIK